MMKFSWNKISAYDFQDLCIPIANKEFARKSFVNYLKSGQKQHGIDLYDISSPTPHICIQCKKYDDGITKTQLKTAIKNFVANDFREKTGTFILATTAALHKAKERTYLEEQKVLFREEYGISFLWWDISILEDMLVAQKAVVQTYFGKYEANKYCLPQLKKEAITYFKEADNYIPRVMVRYSGKESNYWHRRDETLHLAEFLLTGDKQNSRKVCLVGDPYNGKSFYLEHTAYLIQKVHRKKPLLLKIKDYNVQPIDNLLTIAYGFWQEIPFNELVVIIDGLDEAPAPLFEVCARYIDQFIKAYPEVTVVFSCRKFFYDEYSLTNLIQGFESFELYPLQQPGVITYLHYRLKEEFDTFWKKIEDYNLETILYYPFYLTYLVELFLNGERFPTTRIEVLKQFIEHECSSSTRRVANGRTVSKQKEDSYKVLRKFAFALQLAGLNSFGFSEVKALFNKEERELLEQISLITTDAKRWCFTNALFQEHLAALQLAELPIEQILSFVSVGNKVRKIKTKWVQSYCSLLSFVDDKERLQELVDFLRYDNPELIFKTERTKFPLQTRKLFFRELMDRCIALDTRFFTIYETDVAHFLEDSDDTVDYLISLLNDTPISYTIKVMCARTLQQFEIGEHQKESLLACIKAELLTTNNAGYAEYLLELVAKNKLGNPVLIDRWIQLPLNEHHEFRDGMYQVIVSLNRVRDYYNYGLDGLAVLVKHNRVLKHGSSEFQLENFLLQTNNRLLIAKLIRVILSPEFPQMNQYRTESFHKKISDKLAALFAEDPLIIFEVAVLLKAIDKHDLEDDKDFIIKAAGKASANGLMIRLLLISAEKGDWDLKWKYGELLTPDCFDYVLFEYEQGWIDTDDLRALSHGLRHTRQAYAEKFDQLCIDATEDTIWIKDNRHEKHVLHQQKKKGNDLCYLQSLEAFKEGLTAYFTAFGKRVMGIDDLHLDERSAPKRVDVDSDVIHTFLLHQLDEKKIVRLGDFAKFSEDGKSFEYFRAWYILDRTASKEDCEEQLLVYLRSYYYGNLPVADFTNALWTKGNKFYFRTMETLLGNIFRKFQFETEAKYLMDMIWLDDSGARSLSRDESSHYAGTSISLTKLILTKLNEVERRQFRQKVIRNIKIGIRQKEVLGTHISLCDYLVIEEAKELVLDVIKHKKLSIYDMPYCTTLYKKLGGDMAKLVIIFKEMDDYNSYAYLPMATILQEVDREAINCSLLAALRHTASDTNTKLGAAKLLSSCGVMEGFDYLTSLVRVNKQAPYTIQGGMAVYRIDTVSALEKLHDVAYLIIAPEYERLHSLSDSAKNILLEWLDGFASKSEDDLLHVDAFFVDARDKLQTEYPKTAWHFNWYRIRVMEHFRSSDKHGKTIKQIKQILKAIEMDEPEN